jgi:hypothetical protein
VGMVGMVGYVHHSLNLMHRVTTHICSEQTISAATSTQQAIGVFHACLASSRGAMCGVLVGKIPKRVPIGTLATTPPREVERATPLCATVMPVTHLQEQCRCELPVQDNVLPCRCRC